VHAAKEFHELVRRVISVFKPSRLVLQLTISDEISAVSTTDQRSEEFPTRFVAGLIILISNIEPVGLGVIVLLKHIVDHFGFLHLIKPIHFAKLGFHCVSFISIIYFLEFI
jgi:hypothetical protein